MIDERILVLIIPTFVLWVMSMSSHGFAAKNDYRLNVGRFLGKLAGGYKGQVSGRTFSMQLGYASMVLWYVLLRLSDSEYLVENAFALGILFGAVCGLILGWVLKMFSL